MAEPSPIPVMRVPVTLVTANTTLAGSTYPRHAEAAQIADLEENHEPGRRYPSSTLDERD
jgi:hypothetical protein